MAAQNQCLTIENLTLTRAVELAAGLEAAENQLNILKDAHTASQDKIKQLASTSAACWSCFRTIHSL
ncbi:hypothetical protein HPB47_001366, partial [Ixodes persulcatus]